MTTGPSTTCKFAVLVALYYISFFCTQHVFSSRLQVIVTRQNHAHLVVHLGVSGAGRPHVPAGALCKRAHFKEVRGTVAWP